MVRKAMIRQKHHQYPAAVADRKLPKRVASLFFIVPEPPLACADASEFIAAWTAVAGANAEPDVADDWKAKQAVGSGNVVNINACVNSIEWSPRMPTSAIACSRMPPLISIMGVVCVRLRKILVKSTSMMGAPSATSQLRSISKVANCVTLKFATGRSKRLLLLQGVCRPESWIQYQFAVSRIAQYWVRCWICLLGRVQAQYWYFRLWNISGELFCLICYKIYKPVKLDSFRWTKSIMICEPSGTYSYSQHVSRNGNDTWLTCTSKPDDILRSPLDTHFKASWGSNIIPALPIPGI